MIKSYFGTIVLLLLSQFSAAQCDTAAVNREVREIESLIWAAYPQVWSLSKAAVEKYAGYGGWCEGRARYALGKTLWTNGDYSESIRQLREAIRFSKGAEDVETLARSYLVIANDYYYQAYYDSAEANFLRCRDAFVTLKHRTGQIEVLHDMALMYHRRGSYAASLKALLESERLKEQEPDFVHYVGDFSRGNTYFIDTLYYRNVIADEGALLQKFRKSGNRLGVYQTLINISVAYHELADYRKAGYFAALGSRAMKEMGHYPFWYLAAKEYGLAGMKDSCFYFHARAVEEFPQATRIKVVTTYQQLGNSYLEFEQPDSALANFERTLRLSEQMNNRVTIPVVHLSLAKAYRMKGDWSRAEQHVVMGLMLAQGVSVLHASSLYAFGVELYEHLGQPDKALSFARKHDLLNDSINRNEDAMAMIRFQAQFESAKKERELEAARLIVRNRTITLVSLAVVAALSIGFVVVLYIQRRKIQQQNLKLKESNAEQKALMQEVHHRVKNNLQYIVSLLSLQAQNVENDELAQQIEEIKNRIMTMGLIHQRLYQTRGVQAVHLPSFLEDLVDKLIQAHSSRVPITRYLSIDPIRLDVESAIALGLLVNEVTTNAVKHAFANHHAPKFTLEVTREKEGVRVRVSDNGPGFSVRQSVGMGFGMRLIELLLRKLKGTLHQANPNTIDILMTGIGVVE